MSSRDFLTQFIFLLLFFQLTTLGKPAREKIKNEENLFIFSVAYFFLTGKITLLDVFEVD